MPCNLHTNQAECTNPEHETKLNIDLWETAMQTVKQEVASLLDRLPESSSLEDVQYHLYVIEKIRRGLERAESEGTVSQAQAEEHLSKWLIKS